MVKCGEGALPARHSTWRRLSIPGIAVPPAQLKLLIPL